MKTYTGERMRDGSAQVTWSEGRLRARGWSAGYERPLPPRLDLWNHSPTGFEWGYGGSGPAQLALALLANALGDDDRAVRLHQAFKWARIATLPQGVPGDTWQMTETEIVAWAIAQGAEV